MLFHIGLLHAFIVGIGASVLKLLDVIGNYGGSGPRHPVSFTEINDSALMSKAIRWRTKKKKWMHSNTASNTLTEFKYFIHYMLNGLSRVKVSSLAKAATILVCFEHDDVNNRYGRAYRYLKQIDLPEGWEIRPINGKQYCVYNG
jgi:hypothetical protein